MTPAELDAAEVRIGSLDREWVAETMRDMVATLRAAWTERDEARELFQRTHGCHIGWVQQADRATALERERDAYREAFEASESLSAKGLDSCDSAEGYLHRRARLARATTTLRAFGWRPEAER